MKLPLIHSNQICLAHWFCHTILILKLLNSSISIVAGVISEFSPGSQFWKYQNRTDVSGKKLENMMKAEWKQRDQEHCKRDKWDQSCSDRSQQKNTGCEHLDRKLCTKVFSSRVSNLFTLSQHEPTKFCAKKFGPERVVLCLSRLKPTNSWFSSLLRCFHKIFKPAGERLMFSHIDLTSLRRASSFLHVPKKKSKLQ